MATLKISDLSVGDWVMVNDKPRKISVLANVWDGSNEVLVGYVAYVYSNGHNVVFYKPIEKVKPIPITAEILKKIGFEESPDLFTAYHADKVWISYDKRSETWGVTINFDVMPTLYVKLLHVHQLQHALRLAGLDKEINL